MCIYFISELKSSSDGKEDHDQSVHAIHVYMAACMHFSPTILIHSSGEMYILYILASVSLLSQWVERANHKWSQGIMSSQNMKNLHGS